MQDENAMIKAIQDTAAKIMAMSPEDFKKELQEHLHGDVSQILMESGAGELMAKRLNK